MNARRDPDRLIHTFLMEGATELADDVYDTVRDRIEHKRQRAVIGPWRAPDVNPYLKIGLAAAAVLVVAVVGLRQFGSSNVSGPGSGPTQVPTSTPAVTPVPSVASPSSAAVGGLPEGPFVLFGKAPADGAPGAGLTVTIAAPGWYGERGQGILIKNEKEDPPDGSGTIVFAEGPGWYVPGNPCGWQSTMPKTRATTVDQVVAAMAAQTSRDASAITDITVGGYAGKSITLHVPDDAAFATCDKGKFCSLADPETFPADPCLRYAQGAGQIDEMWVVDVKGQPVVIDWTHFKGTPADHLAELEAIVRSTTFQ